MKTIKFVVCFLLLTSTTMMMGCQSQARVFYEGTTSPKVVSEAKFTTLSPDQLIADGYIRIGEFKSEPTSHGQTVSTEDFGKNPQAVYDSIAPENVKSIEPYYASLDRELCRDAAKAGGQLVRLEKIERSYPEMRPDIAELMNKALAEGLTVKQVVSIKHWSVWRKADAAR